MCSSLGPPRDPPSTAGAAAPESGPVLLCRAASGGMHHRPVRLVRSDDKEEGDVCLAIPGQIMDVVDESVGLASVEIAGVRRTVNVGLLDGADPGDWVLVHVGFAIARMD